MASLFLCFGVSAVTWSFSIVNKVTYETILDFTFIGSMVGLWKKTNLFRKFFFHSKMNGEVYILKMKMNQVYEISTDVFFYNTSIIHS